MIIISQNKLFSLKGVMERLGLGPNVIQAFNPRIIYARLTGYGNKYTHIYKNRVFTK